PPTSFSYSCLKPLRKEHATSRAISFDHLIIWKVKFQSLLFHQQPNSFFYAIQQYCQA
ncbi:unnamed protein product, partial [Musa textilis]